MDWLIVILFAGLICYLNIKSKNYKFDQKLQKHVDFKDKQNNDIEEIDLDISKIYNEARDKKNKVEDEYDQYCEKFKELLKPIYYKLDELWVPLDFDFKKSINYGKLELWFENNSYQYHIDISVILSENGPEFCASKVAKYFKKTVYRKDWEYVDLDFFGFYGDCYYSNSYENITRHIVKLLVEYIEK